MSRACNRCGETVLTVLDTRTHCPDPLDAVIAKGLGMGKPRRPLVPALAEDRAASDMFDDSEADRVPELEDALQAALTQRDRARGERDVAAGQVSYLEGGVEQLRAALRRAMGPGAQQTKCARAACGRWLDPRSRVCLDRGETFCTSACAVMHREVTRG